MKNTTLTAPRYDTPGDRFGGFARRAMPPPPHSTSYRARANAAWGAIGGGEEFRGGGVVSTVRWAL